LTLYLICECAGIAASFLIWVFGGGWLGRRRQAYIDANYALQRWWAGTLFRGAQRIFRLALEVERPAGLDAGPLILFLRHASLPDVILPAALFVIPHRLRIRHVMKTELLWDPCLDIVGCRIPNCFVRRGAAEGAQEIEKVRRLAVGLGPRDGVMIYPEGTRFTEQKKERALERLRNKGDARTLARASALRHVLPPRLGGSLALLECAGHDAALPAPNVVFCAHVGFESVGKARNFLDGSLIGKTVRVKLWGIPFAEIPREREPQIDWLYDNWLRVDDWVSRHS
jgi:1-acyl-sn-glycerol-3-phosphate acyltransferase